MDERPEILTDDVEHVPIDDVREHPANPRDGDVAAIQESIRENGFYGALVVQESSGKILAGNHRWVAAREEGLDTVPVVYVDVGDERALRILLADNKTADEAEYHRPQLAELLEHLNTTANGLGGTGYNGDELDQILEDLDDPGEDEWADAFGDVPEGEKGPFQQKTFTLHDTQAETVDAAVQRAKDNDFSGTPNENSNGNALALICEHYLQHG